MKARITGWAIGSTFALAMAFVLYGPEQAAHADQHGTVAEERSNLMKGMGGAMRTLNGFIRGNKSAAEAAEAAALIAVSAPEIAAVFPPDTGMGTNPRSEAKDTIWEAWDEFTAAAVLLGDKAAALETAIASGDTAATAAAFGDLGKSGCGGCHSRFREKRN